MSQRRTNRLAAALLAVAAITQHVIAQDDGWRLGRATYYAAPRQVVLAYDPARGEGSFGVLAFGSCGYTNLPQGDLPFPRETYAAAADTNPDFPGSCGRCYEVRCKPGLVLNNEEQPIRLVYLNRTTDGRPVPGNQSIAYFDGDVFRPYLPSINPNVPDDFGRRYPGNPEEGSGQVFTECYDPNKSLVVRIADSCPCTQKLEETAPGVKAGGEVRRQEWCCGPVQHFDLSYWAFEQLAHPVSGAMMLEYRPVDCDTSQPLPSPNYISPVLLDRQRGVQPGWGVSSYNAGSVSLQVPVTLPDGGSGRALCTQLSPKGGVALTARQASRPGFQPLAGKTTLQFLIRSNSNSTDPFASSTPVGEVPGLKLFVLNEERQNYCGTELQLGNTTLPTSQEGDWFVFQVPLSEFACEGAGVPQADVDRVEWQNIAERDAYVCLTGVQLS